MQEKTQKLWQLTGLFLLIVLMLFIAQRESSRVTFAEGVTTLSAESATTGNNDHLNCRFGINADETIEGLDVVALGAGWYIDYQSDIDAARPGGIEYSPVVRMRQTGTDTVTYWPAGSLLEEAVLSNPGAPWLVGNEPDRSVFQDDTEPELYATAYYEIYHTIKAVDQRREFLPAPLCNQPICASSILSEFYRPIKKPTASRFLRMDGQFTTSFSMKSVVTMIRQIAGEPVFHRALTRSLVKSSRLMTTTISKCSKSVLSSSACG